MSDDWQRENSGTNHGGFRHEPVSCEDCRLCYECDDWSGEHVADCDLGRQEARAADPWDMALRQLDARSCPECRRGRGHAPDCYTGELG